MPPVRRRIQTIAAVALGATPLAAQTPPTTIPGLEKFSLPGSPTATPTPLPSPTPLPRPTPPVPAAPARQPTAPVATPSPRATPRPQTTPTPAPTPVASPTPVPSPTPAITPTPSLEDAPATPAPEVSADAPPIEVAPEQAQPTDRSAWRYLGWLAALALAGFLVWLVLSRRTGRRPATRPLPKPVAPTAVPDPSPSLAPPAPLAPRARLAIDLRPTRAGLNLLSATVDCEVCVTNTGDAPAEAVHFAVRLFSAHADQEADLAAFRAQPIVRPAAAPFALAPGETRAVRAVAALPHADIRPLDAAGRPMFVPVVAVNALYRAGEGRDGRTVQAFVVGIERVDSPKLAPFWLDQPPRTVTAVAARAHGAAIETDGAATETN